MLEGSCVTKYNLINLQSLTFKVQQVELRVICRGDKIVARFVLHENKNMNSHEGICRCNMSPGHFLVCEVAVILSQLHVPATRPCLISPEWVYHKN